MSRVAACLCLPVWLLGCDATAPQEAAAEPSVESPAASTSSAELPISRGGSDLVGTPAMPLAADLDWMGDEALSLESLRGKVVLVRFWTDACPFCEASAPGLTQLHERYGDEGFVVLGLFHSKPRGAVREMSAVKARAKELGMTFAIASDARWDTLERWWLASGEGKRAATSVSFLIDAQGIIRWVHPGPEFHPDGPEDHAQCRADFDDAVQAIEVLLAERKAANKVG